MVWVQHLRGGVQELRGGGAFPAPLGAASAGRISCGGAYAAGVSWYTVDVPLRVLVRSNPAAISHLMAPCTARSDRQVRMPMVLMDGQQ